MMLESQTCRELSAFFRSLKGAEWLETAALASRHNSIQYGLDALAGFFDTLGRLADGNEDVLISSMPYSGGGPSGLQTSWSAKGPGLLPAAVQGKIGTGTYKAHYAAGSASCAWQDENVSASAKVNALEGEVKIDASLRLWNKSGLDPQLSLSASAFATLVNASLEGKAGNDQISLSARAQGECGSVFGKAKAVLNADGVDIDASAGAAALRGSCVVAVDLMGLKLSLTLSGTVLGCDASAVYRHTAHSWEAGVGASLGIGGSMKLGLDWN